MENVPVESVPRLVNAVESYGLPVVQVFHDASDGCVEVVYLISNVRLDEIVDATKYQRLREEFGHFDFMPAECRLEAELRRYRKCEKTIENGVTRYRGVGPYTVLKEVYCADGSRG